MLNLGRPSEAELGARAQLQASPDSGLLWKILGVALMRQGKDAMPALRKAAELLPQDAEAHRNLGAVLHDQGLLDEALVSLRRVLQIEPGDVDVRIAIANTLCASGRAREALPLYRQALQVNPHSAEVHNNLGNALQELGECAEAITCYHAALAIKPDDAETHCNLANALRQSGQLDAAIGSCERALALAPGMSLAYNNLGLTLAALGRRTEAVASLRQAVKLNPRFGEALKNLGQLLRELGDPRAAVALYRTAIGLNPQGADGHYHLGEALYELGEPTEAVVSFRRALALRPDYAAAHLGLATALRLLGQNAAAQQSCRDALAADARHVGALCLLGDLHADRGEFASARELFQRSLAIDAEFPPAFCSIAAQRRMTPDDAAWLHGAEALLAKSLPLEHEIGLRYALGKYHDDLKQYDAAFGQYQQANELSKRFGAKYDGAGLTRQVDQIISRFSGASLRQSHRGASDSELPVLVIGMPRSGTSLIEQILASHPHAFGAGELRFWDGALEAFSGAGPASAAAAHVLARITRDYLHQLSAPAGQALRVVDKMPANFLYAGLIHSAFPRVKILHVRRDPRDTCVSIYFQNFFRMHPYASDLGDLAHHYREYERISAHWRTALPATTLLEIPYEQLIEDQEYWTRRMLEFIGLPWEPRCLDFHETARVVITASRWQVRQKISAASIGRWRNYAKYLGPLQGLDGS
jgi:tetratricopeptide (TPR) repeat protein